MVAAMVALMLALMVASVGVASPARQVSDFHNQAQDDDVIETQLDNTMRSVLKQVHGCEALEDEVRCWVAQQQWRYLCVACTA